MATILSTRIQTKNTRAFVTRWTPLAAGDDGEAVEFSQYTDRSVQVTGTFGAGGSVVIEGSNDGGSNWATLTDPQGNPLTINSAKIELVSEAVAQVRPRVTGGDGTTALAINMLLKE